MSTPRGRVPDNRPPSAPGMDGPTRVRAARCHAYGPPESVVVEEVPAPVPAPGQAVVAVRAAAVNYPDVLFIANRYQVSVPPPFTPGSEFAGVVVAVAADVTQVRPGDAVIGAGTVGAFAEQVAADAAGLSPIPSGMDFHHAAGFSTTYHTAYSALRSVAEVRPGEWVVVLGAAGGVGSATLDIARRLGCRVLAAVSTAEKVAACREWGADVSVNYSVEDLKDRIKELTGGGADVVIDPVGGELAEEALRALRWGGRFVTVGFASGTIPRIPLNLVLLKWVTIKGIDLRTFAEHAPDLARRDRAALWDLAASGLQPHISAVYPLDRVTEALRAVADRKATGKIIIDMSGALAPGEQLPASANSIAR